MPVVLNRVVHPEVPVNLLSLSLAAEDNQVLVVAKHEVPVPAFWDWPCGVGFHPLSQKLVVVNHIIEIIRVLPNKVLASKDIQLLVPSIASRVLEPGFEPVALLISADYLEHLHWGDFPAHHSLELSHRVVYLDLNLRVRGY